MFGKLLTIYVFCGKIQSAKGKRLFLVGGIYLFAKDNLRDMKRSDFYEQVFFSGGR